MRFVAALMMLALAACSRAALAPGEPAASPNTIPVSSTLAFVASGGSDGFDTPVPTAICIASDDNDSFFLTSAHAVQPGAAGRLAVLRDGALRSYPLTIVRRSRAPLDLAVVTIPLGAFPVATFSTAPVPRGRLLTEYNYRDLATLKTPSPLQTQNVLADTVFSDSVLRATGLDDGALTGGPLTDASGAVVAIVTFYVPASETRFTVATTARAVLPFVRAAGIVPRVTGPATADVPPVDGYAAVTACLDSERLRNDAATVDRCAAAYFSLVPSTLLMHDEGARAQTLTTVYDLFRCTHATALAQARLGDRTYGLVNAVQAIGWGRRLLRIAPPGRAATLRAEVAASLLEVAGAYPTAAQIATTRGL